MKAFHARKSLSLAYCGSVGSFRYCTMRMPWQFAKPAGFMTDDTEVETPFRYCAAFQPISPALLIAWAAHVGVAMLENTLAPVSLSWMLCESTVGSATS